VAPPDAHCQLHPGDDWACIANPCIPEPTLGENAAIGAAGQQR
jgi:hypothetical protein